MERNMPQSGNAIAGGLMSAGQPLQTQKEISRPSYLTISEAVNGYVIMTNNRKDYDVEYFVAADIEEAKKIVGEYLTAD